MNGKFFKALGVIAIFALMFQLVSPVSASTNAGPVLESEENARTSYYDSVMELYQQQHGENGVTATSVAVFFGGIVVAWLIDGVIEYTTGHNASFWVAKGLSNMESKIKSYGSGLPNGYVIDVQSNGALRSCIQAPCQLYGVAPEV